MTVPLQIGMTETVVNPVLPPRPPSIKPSRYRSPGAVNVVTETHGSGANRIYLDIQSQPPSVAYPPRPVPGSVADMDEIMKHCHFSQGKVATAPAANSLTFAHLP
jgi:WD repeat and SOF domain-containing protein 1